MDALQCREKEVLIPFDPDFGRIRDFLSSKYPDEQILRFASLETKENHFCANILTTNQTLSSHDIFTFQKRKTLREDHFNVCFLIPTGIGCEIGGHAGDATPSLKAVSALCDTVVIHPNVVNASDINEMPSNALYVEGYHLTNFLMGNIGLGKSRNNKILVLIEKEGSTNDSMKSVINLTVNSINAARATLGIDAEILFLESKIKMKAILKKNRATGEIALDSLLMKNLKQKQKENNFDAIAISSPIKVPKGTHRIYSESRGKMINPWGGVESMLTHMTSSEFNIPTAHAPRLENDNVLKENYGITDARIAPEIISSTFFYSVLKGLQKAPKIVSPNEGMSVKDISAIIIPEGTLGLPVLAALHHGITVISVKNENKMRNNLDLLPWKKNQLFKCNSYLEACGILCCLKEGISVESTKRPFQTLQKKEILFAKQPENFEGQEFVH